MPKPAIMNRWMNPTIWMRPLNEGESLVPLNLRPVMFSRASFPALGNKSQIPQPAPRLFDESLLVALIRQIGVFEYDYLEIGR